MLTLRFVKLLVVVMSALVLAVLTLPASRASAAELGTTGDAPRLCADAEGTEALTACILRLRQPLWDTSSPFGATTQLGQTFLAPKTSRVCKVQALLVKGAANNGPLIMRVETLGGAALDVAVAPAGPLPIGVPTWVTFNFNCDGGVLVGGNPYRLVLSAPQSPVMFKWLRHNGSIIPGQALSRVLPGAFAPVLPLDSDFTFHLYMCS